MDFNFKLNIMYCNICGFATNKILSLNNRRSITSLGRLLEATAHVYVCASCSHAQTNASMDLASYYASDYKTLSFSVNEDDLYELQNGQPIYRNEHMAVVLSRKINNLNGDILDYGCGKSLVMKHYKGYTQNRIYLFDVSKDYVQFWREIIPESQYSFFEIPSQWESKFCLVTSFFSMEHVPKPLDTLKNIRRVLMPDGLLYIVVPNMYSANTADMLVVDHMQHYSEPSMKMLLRMGGFDVVAVDHVSHYQASIFIAQKRGTTYIAHSSERDKESIATYVQKCQLIASFWNRFFKSIKFFENGLQDRGINKYYIVGAGIIGAQIYLQLKRSECMIGFIDSNKFKQIKGWQGKRVFDPFAGKIDTSSAFFIGLNMEQIAQILPKIMPNGVPEENIWSMKLVGE